MAATVLVVEDERKLRDFIRSYLERASFTVLSTGSGAEAITMATAAALLRAVAGTAGLAALLALVTGLVVARRITRPIARLITVARAMASGDRSARAGERSGRHRGGRGRQPGPEVRGGRGHAGPPAGHGTGRRR
jgi:CheY-like chemotaxis protein